LSGEETGEEHRMSLLAEWDNQENQINPGFGGKMTANPDHEVRDRYAFVKAADGSPHVAATLGY
jgi:hypothetical protein